MNRPSPPVRVLVVDDIPAIHDDFRKILCPDRIGNTAVEKTEAELFGTLAPDPISVEFEVTAVTDGLSAITAVDQSVAQHRRFAVVFQDVRMGPGMDGVQTALGLWGIDPDLQIVLCTAYSDYTWRELRHRFGRRDNLVYLKKPFEYLEVLQLAHTLAERWETRRTRVAA